MRLVYIANIRLPTEKAHGIQIMKTCEALSKQGVEVELIVPRRLNPIKDNPFAFYGVEKNFKIARLWCLDLISLNIFGSLGYLVESWTFYRSVKKYLKQMPSGIYYTRDLPIVYWLSREVSPLFYEIHTLPGKISQKYRRAWERAKGLVVISNGLKQELEKQGIAKDKILLARDAVDVTQFQIKETKEECRAKLGLSRDQRIAVYTGHLYEWKGAGTLAETAQLLPSDTHIYLVGGTAPDIVRFKQKYQLPNLRIIGWQPHHQIPYWLKAADTLVLPTSGKNRIGALYTSPMKLFEYMTAGRPMIVSDLPSIREVIDDKAVTFFITDDPNSLAKAIQEVLSNQGKVYQKAQEALRLVEQYSWQARASLIRQFLFR